LVYRSGEVHRGDVDVPVRSEIDPRRPVRRQIDDADPDLRIRRPRLRIPHRHELGVERVGVQQIEGPDRRLVEPPERDAAAVRARSEERRVGKEWGAGWGRYE